MFCDMVAFRHVTRPCNSATVTISTGLLSKRMIYLVELLKLEVISVSTIHYTAGIIGMSTMLVVVAW